MCPRYVHVRLHAKPLWPPQSTFISLHMPFLLLTPSSFLPPLSLHLRPTHFFRHMSVSSSEMVAYLPVLSEDGFSSLYSIGPVLSFRNNSYTLLKLFICLSPFPPSGVCVFCVSVSGAYPSRH